MARPRLAPDTRDRILDAVDELLARQGYRRMTIEQVARRAGIGKGSVYLQFASKEDLVLASIDRIALRLLARMRVIAREPIPAPERLRRLLVARVLVRLDGAQQHSRSLDELLAGLRPRLLERRRIHFEREAALLAEVLRQGQREGTVRGVSPRPTAQSLVLGTNALLPYSLSAAELGQRASIARKARRIAFLLVRGLEGPDREEESS